MRAAIHCLEISFEFCNKFGDLRTNQVRGCGNMYCMSPEGRILRKRCLCIQESSRHVGFDPREIGEGEPLDQS